MRAKYLRDDVLEFFAVPWNEQAIKAVDEDHVTSVKFLWNIIFDREDAQDYRDSMPIKERFPFRNALNGTRYDDARVRRLYHARQKWIANLSRQISKYD